MAKNENVVSAIKWIAIGSVISEYGALMLQDGSKHELKQRVTTLKNAAQSVQNWFTYHPNTTGKTRDAFKKEFLSSEVLLMAELMETIWGLNEKDLEDILIAIKNNIIDE